MRLALLTADERTWSEHTGRQWLQHRGCILCNDLFVPQINVPTLACFYAVQTVRCEGRQLIACSSRSRGCAACAGRHSGCFSSPCCLGFRAGLLCAVSRPASGDVVGHAGMRTWQAPHSAAGGEGWTFALRCPTRDPTMLECTRHASKTRHNRRSVQGSVP